MNTATEPLPAILNIMVVDDDPTDLKLTYTVLKEAGHIVTEAKDAESALALLGKFRPHIVLIDMELPGMNGLALAREMKQLPAVATIPIIAMTAYPERFSREKVSEHGFSSYFVKPISTRTLVQQVVAAARKGCARLFTATILIADDNTTNRNLLRAVLDAEGYRVVEVRDGWEALAELQASTAPVVALLDWEMPGIEGIDVCRRARERADAPPMFLILHTVRNHHRDIIAGLNAGANDYITKPFQRGELLARVKIGTQMVELQQSLALRVNELQDALAEVRKLSGFLPICSYCKKIRDDRDYWQSVETYVAKHTDAKFSHGICPECFAARVQPELDKLGITASPFLGGTTLPDIG